MDQVNVSLDGPRHGPVLMSLHQGTGNEPVLNLRGSATDRPDPCVPKVPFYRIFGGISGAAEYLYCVGGMPVDRFGGKCLDHGCLDHIVFALLLTQTSSVFASIDNEAELEVRESLDGTAFFHQCLN